MGAVTFAFRAELRSRWRSWLAIALLISLVGGFVLAATAAGRRTDAALPAFVAGHGFDAVVYASAGTRVPKHSAIPEVTSITSVFGLDNGQPTCACPHPLNSSDFSIISVGRGRPIWNLVAGRLPDPSEPDQVLASESLIQAEGLRLGSVVHVPLFAASQASAYNNAVGDLPTPRGPNVVLHVVGIEASAIDLPSGSAPNYVLFTSPAFTRDVLPKTAYDDVYLLRLRHGAADLPLFNRQISVLTQDGVQGVQNEDEQIASVEAAVHPQAVGWWLLAALAGLVGLAVVGQALARQSTLEAEDYPTMTALGAERGQLVLLGLARNLAVAGAGAVGAVALGTVLSPMAPEGEARLVESATGISFDAPVLVLGALATVVVVVVLGIWPAVRASRWARPDRREPVANPSAVVTRLAAVGAPPSALIGVRNALQRTSVGSDVPVGTALLGTVLAVTALCGTLVFGASLTHLTTTPALYGDAFQLNFTVYPGAPDAKLLADLRSNGSVTAISRGLATQVSIGGTSVGAVAGQSLRGPLLFSADQGRLPGGDGQIGLGASTMRQLGTRLGSVVEVTVLTPTGGRRTVPFRVVSQVSFPVLGGVVGLGNGAIFTIHGYEAAACPPGPGQASCPQGVVDTSNGGILVGVAPGPQGRRAIVHYVDTYRSITAFPVTPTSLVNFGEAVDFPLIFGGLLAVFGAATLVHLLLVSVSRRRREIALMRVLGFVNRQVVGVVAWQATTVALVGIVIGVPLGVIAGKATWHLFAAHLGVVPVSVVPLGLVGVLVVSVVVVANLLAIGPATVAARSKPTRLLRSQ